MAPFLNNTYDGAQLVDDEMRHVAWLLTEAAMKTLPQVQGRKTSKYWDATLSCLCVQSRVARKAWLEAGCPSEGPLHEEKGRLRRAVRRRVRFVLQHQNIVESKGERGCLPLELEAGSVHPSVGSLDAQN